jgi:hypothetical protein
MVGKKTKGWGKNETNQSRLGLLLKNDGPLESSSRLTGPIALGPRREAQATTGVGASPFPLTR